MSLREKLIAALTELESATGVAGQKCPECGAKLSMRTEMARSKIVQLVQEAKQDLEIT